GAYVAGHADGDFCAVERIGPDRGRRGTRRLVQTAGWAALFGARPGGMACTRSERASGAGLGHAVVGKLASRGTRPLSAPGAAGARAIEQLAGDSLDRHPALGDAPRHVATTARSDRPATRARRAIIGISESPWLRPRAALRIVCVGQPLSALLGVYRAASGGGARQSFALPPLRLSGAGTAGLSGMRRSGSGT